ncbi:endonuclease/exonuclease/phosphatase family protein [Cellulomonas sp. URHB0016]
MTTPHPAPRPADGDAAAVHGAGAPRSPRQTRSTPPDAGTPTRVWLVASLTVLGVELLRASGPLLDRWFAVGTASAAVAAIGTYAGAGVVAAVLLLVTGRTSGVPGGRTLLVGVSVLAAARLALQALDGLALDVAGLLTVALAVGVLTLAVAFVAGRPAGGRQAAVGLVVGTGLSVGLQLVLGTWDAVWRSGGVGWLVAALVALAPLGAARALVGLHQGPALLADIEATGRPRRLWALGPYLALVAMILANPAFAASQSGVALGVAGLVLVVAGTVGAWLLLRPDPWPAAVRVTSAVVLVAGTAVALLATGPAALVAVAVVEVVVGIVLTGTLSAHRPAPRGIARTAGAVALTGLGVIGPLLLYMLDYDVPLRVDNAWVMVAAALVLALTGLRRRTPGAPRTPHERMPARVSSVRLLLLPAVVLALLGLVPSTTSTTGSSVPERAAGDSLALVDWNLHYGVSPLTAVDLEAVARTIEAQHPDVVTLQEVERGWILGGGADVATWLSHRLGMTIRFAPAADHQFGNAVLARSGLTDVVVHPLPYGAGPQDRSALSTTITTATGHPVRVTSVHLQHRAENTATRLEQLETLLAAEPVTGPSVLAGDLNAVPGSPETTLLEDAGWVSAIDSVGDPDALTQPSTGPTERIDWVFGQGVSFASAAVLTDPRESDHLPLVVVLSVP